MAAKELLKRVIEQTPYRVVRNRGGNRFQAIEVSLLGMKERGYDAKYIIDGGAHLGSFSLSTKKIFPKAAFHLIEPQSACLPSLKKACAAHGFALYECALSDCEGEVNFAETAEPSTGAHVIYRGPDGCTVAASTLDTLFAERITPEDRALLKLDLQGYELHALRGGLRILRVIEVILLEVSFFAQAYEPKIVQLLNFLDENAFELYDIASLSGRARDNRLHQGDWIFIRKSSELAVDCSWE